jgi:hypothetical protein
MSQLDLFGRPQRSEPASDLPDPDIMRLRMGALLAELEQAGEMPWPEKKVRLYRILWPQMSRWLPEDERANLIGRFETEITRLSLRSAA